VHGTPETSSNLVFGNAELHSGLEDRFARRGARFRRWIAERTAGGIVLPERLLDFSVQKGFFASAALEGPTPMARLHAGGNSLLWLLKSLWLRHEDGVLRKLALTSWAVAVLLIPRLVATPLARYVCNPASRGR
jgi:hypothetical protein